MRTIMILTAACFLSACSSIPRKMSQLSPGMPKADAIKLLGEPDNVSNNGHAEYAYWEKRIVGFGDERNFFVRFEGDRVESFGQVPFQSISPAAAMAVMQYRPIQPYQVPVYQMPVSQPVNCMSNNVGGTTYTNCR